MARQIIDTTTTNSPIGDPAKTAFEKSNANFAELYGFSATFTVSSAPVFTGDIIQNKNTAAEVIQSTPNAVNRYRRFANVSDSVDGGYRIDRWNGADYVEKLKIENTRVGITTDFDVRKNTPSASLTSPGGNMGWRGFANVSDTVDGGYSIQNIVSGAWTTKMSVNTAGTVTAVTFNPTSTADVKDFIEGYSGDACAELDRLAVITYRYREGFGGPTGVVAGLLAENVHDIWPDAVGGDYDEIVEEPVVLPDGSQQLDEEGAPVTVPVKRHVPMNIDMMQVLARTVRAHQQKSRKLRQHAHRIEAVTGLADVLAERVDALEAAVQRLDEIAAMLEGLQALADRVTALESAA